MIDVSADEGWLATSLRCMHLVQMVVQGHWLHDCTLLTLPGVCVQHFQHFKRPKGAHVETLPELLNVVRDNRSILETMLGRVLDTREVDQVRFKNSYILLVCDLHGVSLNSIPLPSHKKCCPQYFVVKVVFIEPAMHCG